MRWRRATRRLRDTLPGEIERLQATLTELAQQKDALNLEISDLKGVRETLFAARAEAAALTARIDALEARYQESATRCQVKSKGCRPLWLNLGGRKMPLTLKSQTSRVSGN